MKKIETRMFPVKEYFTLLLAIVISLILLFSNENSQVNTLRKWSLHFSGNLLEKITFFNRLLSVYEENIELKKENIRLMLEAVQYREALLENIRFRKLIGFRLRNEFDLIPATVIGHGSSLFSSSIILDVGKQQELKKNMVLVTADGLVGKIITVADNYSVGHVLLDRNFRVSAKIQRSRLKGIVRWDRGRFCSMDGIAKRADVGKGDVIVTSGYSTVFPPGLKIGVVIETSDLMNRLFKKVIIQSSVDFDRLEEVFILKAIGSKVPGNINHQ